MSSIGKIWQWFKSFATSRDALMFVFFVLFSTMLWYGRTNANKYQHTITIDIDYIGLTPDIETTDSLPHSLKITYTDTNRPLIYKKPKIDFIHINLSQQLQSNSKQLSVSAGELQALVLNEMPATVSIQRIEPANIQTSFDRLSSKTLPIRFVGTLYPAAQYQIVGDYVLEPANITIYGNKKQLDTIAAIETKPQQINNIKDDFEREIELQPINGIRFSQQNVLLSAKASAFTETSFQLPISIVGCPNDVEVKTFPASVTITIQLSIEEYKHLNKSNIIAMVDYDDMLRSTNGVVKVYVAAESAHIFDAKVKPENVEFIIEKKIDEKNSDG